MQLAGPDRTSCPDEDTVDAFFQGLLSHQEADSVDTHVDQCSACRALFSQIARSMASNPDVPPEVSEGAEQASLHLPRLGDSYRIIRKIGEGGMATVFEVAHTRVERRFAVKVLHERLAQDPQMTARFDREARIGSRLGHEHIVQVFDFDRTADGQAYLVMELLEGQSLSEILRRERRLPLDWSVAVLRQVASAISAAHEDGVIHRDLKPGNIFLCGRARRQVSSKVLDFGLVKGVGRHDAGHPRLGGVWHAVVYGA